MTATPRSPISPGVALVLLASPFYLNDFANLFIKDWRLWLLIDYLAVKLLPLAAICWLLGSRRLQRAQFGLVWQAPLPFIVTFMLLVVAGTLLDQNAYTLVASWPGYAALGGMPAITSPAWNWVDLTLGLLLVALLEELVFRGLAHAALSRITDQPLVIAVVSGLAFGLIHWSGGAHAVMVTTVIGMVFMAVYLRTRSLPALVLAHFVVNFIDFAGVIPKAVFKLV